MQQRLGQLGVLPRVAVISTVPSESVGLLFIDGTLRQTLDAGLHAFWNFNGNVSVERVELRARSLDVSGQELLSRDKVTLRVNLAATVQVVDPVRAHRTLSNADEFVYRQLQFGLRQAIADDPLRVAPDFQGIVFHPARPRECLRMLHLRGGMDAPFVREQDETGAGGALVEASDVTRHDGHSCGAVPIILPQRPAFDRRARPRVGCVRRRASRRQHRIPS